MRHLVALALLAAPLACGDSTEAVNVPVRTIRTSPETPPPAEVATNPPTRPNEKPPLEVAEPPPPTSPFLVQPKPTGTTTTTAEPPPLSPPPPPPPPPPPTATNAPGKPCPVGRCLLGGKCVIPGGPIDSPNNPPGAVVTACGGDGGPCSRCRCVSPNTMLSTPAGDRPIVDLRTGDFVYSVHEGRVSAVPILATQRVAVKDHAMARLRLQNGFVLEISGEHPTGDGRSLFDLSPGEPIGETIVEELSVVPWEGSFTVDVLPDSDTGTYFVHGLWLGSTMFGLSRRGDHDIEASAAH